MNQLVTIIIVSYNSESTIDACVRSLLAQTYKNLEIIICDDFSTDQTLNVLRKITDQRLKIIAGKRNLGPNGNTNRGLSCANGEFVCIAGGDDMFKENKIEKQVNFFISHDHVNLVCNGLSSAPSEKQDVPIYSNNIIFDANKILNTPFYTVGAMVRWDKDNPIYTNERFTTNDNIYYFTYIGRRGGSFAILPDRLSYYVRTKSGLNSSGPRDYARKIFIQWEILHSFTVLHIYSYFKLFEVLKFYLKSFTSLSLTIFRYCGFNLRQKWTLKK